MPAFIDLNADLGEESPGEADVLRFVSSANVACGAHAGSEAAMRASVRLARARGVAVGAHPGFADRESFGRRELPVTADEAYALVASQVRLLQGIARLEGTGVAHVKPHGALYNMAARDADLARAVARAVADSGIPILYGLAESELVRAALEAGLRAVGEAFADRGYTVGGALVPRGESGALLAPGEATAQALSIALRGEATAVTGERVRVEAGTLCLHGDGKDAARLAHDLREALEEAGVTVRAP